MLHDTLQILYAIVRGHHIVVAQVLRLRTRVCSLALVTAPPQAAVTLQLLGDLTAKHLFLVVGVLELWTVLVTPLDGPAVVVVDTREEASLTNLILRLCHIVEAGIVHDARRVAVLLHPCFVAQFLNGCC